MIYHTDYNNKIYITVNSLRKRFFKKISDDMQSYIKDTIENQISELIDNTIDITLKEHLQNEIN